ncbi:MAG: ATP-binding protein [Chitinophagaceae bacterium]
MLSTREFRIVIVDDDEDDFLIISDYIKAIEGGRFVIEWCNDYNSAMEIIRQRSGDIYFVDYRLGNHTGLDLLKAAQAEGFDDPFVILTGKGNKVIDIKAVESGATDYLVKSELTTEKIERCIRYSLVRAGDLKELKARENKYRNLFETSKDAVFIADERLDLREVNHAATGLFKLGVSDLTGINLLDFIKNESIRTRVQELSSRKRNFHDLEIEMEDAEKEKKACLLSLAFSKDNEDKPVVHGILHDISGIKKAELANLQAHKLAMNERLMRTLAHEIRNPLNNISLSIEHFSMPLDSEEEKMSLVEIMKRNCTRINHIITELLDLTKPLELTFQPHSLQEILDESIQMITDRMNLQKIYLNKKYPDESVVIPANKAKLVIAFTNILINAVEAMESGKGELSVTINGSGDHASVLISDNGAGIPQEHLSRLFEPFFTLKKNGVGLGLSVSYSIIQSHNAAIDVRSELQNGTQFHIAFNQNPA